VKRKERRGAKAQAREGSARERESARAKTKNARAQLLIMHNKFLLENDSPILKTQPFLPSSFYGYCSNLYFMYHFTK
jgi:hypothetical protein